MSVYIRRRNEMKVVNTTHTYDDLLFFVAVGEEERRTAAHPHHLFFFLGVREILGDI